MHSHIINKWYIVFAFTGLLVTALVTHHTYQTKVLFLEREAAALGELSPSATTIATASARVLEQLVITGKTPLRFGVIESAQNGGEIVVTPYHTRQVKGNVKVSETTPFDPAKFDIRGVPNTNYSIHIPASLTFTKEGAVSVSGVTALQVVDFRSYSANAAKETRLGKINGNGIDTVYVGGTLIVPPTAASGSYSGEVLMTVTY